MYHLIKGSQEYKGQGQFGRKALSEAVELARLPNMADYKIYDSETGKEVILSRATPEMQELGLQMSLEAYRYYVNVGLAEIPPSIEDMPVEYRALFYEYVQGTINHTAIIHAAMEHERKRQERANG